MPRLFPDKESAKQATAEFLQARYADLLYCFEILTNLPATKLFVNHVVISSPCFGCDGTILAFLRAGAGHYAGTNWRCVAGSPAQVTMKDVTHYQLDPESGLSQSDCGGYTIRLTTSGGLSESSTVLTSIEPGKTASLVARVFNQNNQLVPNASIELKLGAVQHSGGHHHGNDALVERTGTFSATGMNVVVSDNGKMLSGNTGTGGLLFDYQAPKVSGDIDINAVRCTDGKSCTHEGAKQVWVGIKNLVQIPAVPEGLPFAAYQLFEPTGVPVGHTNIHPHNHYLTPEAILKLWNLGFRYRAEFPDNPLLHVNDASLERGGIFDIKGNWKPGHHEHQRGTVVDIRANHMPGAIPESAFTRVEKMAHGIGIDAQKHVDRNKDTGEEIVGTRHFHVRLMGRRE